MLVFVPLLLSLMVSGSIANKHKWSAVRFVKKASLEDWFLFLLGVTYFIVCSLVHFKFI